MRANPGKLSAVHQWLGINRSARALESAAAIDLTRSLCGVPLKSTI
jgi:hypothetical protein